MKLSMLKVSLSMEGSTLVLAAGMLMLVSAALGTWFSGYKTQYMHQLLDIFD